MGEKTRTWIFLPLPIPQRHSNDKGSPTMASSPWFVCCASYLLHIRWEPSPDLIWFPLAGVSFFQGCDGHPRPTASAKPVHLAMPSSSGSPEFLGARYVDTICVFANLYPWSFSSECLETNTFHVYKNCFGDVKCWTYLGYAQIVLPTWIVKEQRLLHSSVCDSSLERLCINLVHVLCMYV
jgi:hypothetical protein